jgi:hypothetical protein
MTEDKIVWYRQLSSPGVEFYFRLGKGAPKHYELVLRSIADHQRTQVHQVADPSVGVSHYLVAANLEFARQINQEVLDARKQRLDAIAAREAKEQRAISEGEKREPEGQGQGEPGKEDPVPANHDERNAKAGAQGAEQGHKTSRKRTHRQPKNGRGDHQAVPQAGS